MTTKQDREPPKDPYLTPDERAGRYVRAQGLAGGDPLEQVTEIAELCGQHDPEQSTLAESVKDRLDGKDDEIREASNAAEGMDRYYRAERDQRERAEAEIRVLVSLVQRLLDEAEEGRVVRGPLYREARAKVAELTKREEG